MKRFYIDLWNTRRVQLSGFSPLIKISIDNLTDALSLEKKEFEKFYNSDKPEKSDTIVFICRKGMTANKAIFLSSKLGYKSTCNLHIVCPNLASTLPW
jgi:hypothetical protein